MKKRILALLLCIVMVLSITIITSAEDTEAPLTGAPLTEVPLCTCGTEDDTHAEACPMYAAPEAPAEPEAPTEPEAPAEDTPQDNSGLFDQLMACETFDAFADLLESLTEDQFASLDEAQLAQLESRLAELMPEPDPEVVIEEEADIPATLELDEGDWNEPITPAVDFTDVAPIGGR